jgi:hypothetical protein
VDVAWSTESELEKYSLTPTATRVIRKAFQMSREAHATPLPPAK